MKEPLVFNLKLTDELIGFQLSLIFTSCSFSYKSADRYRCCTQTHALAVWETVAAAIHLSELELQSNANNNSSHKRAAICYVNGEPLCLLKTCGCVHCTKKQLHNSHRRATMCNVRLHSKLFTGRHDWLPHVKQMQHQWSMGKPLTNSSVLICHKLNSLGLKFLTSSLWFKPQ